MSILKQRYFVYVVQNQVTLKLYTGQTNNLSKRLARHNGLLPTKRGTYTSKQAPAWRYVYTEAFETRSQALAREKELKSGQGREYIKKQLRENHRIKHGSVAQLVRSV